MTILATQKCKQQSTDNETNRNKISQAILFAAILLAAATISLPTNLIALASSPNLTVTSQDTSGDNLSGYWTVISQNGATVQTGFTPTSTILTAGSYTVSVSDYGGYYFSHWSDGATTRDRSVSIGTSSTVNLVAVYSTSTGAGSVPIGSSITVNSQYSDGTSFSGMYVLMQQNSATLDTGFTPKTFSTTSGQTFALTPEDYTNAYFLKWSDGSTARTKIVTAADSSSILVAIYASTPTTIGSTSSSGNLVIASTDSHGNSINGYWTAVSQGGTTVKSGFTPFTASLPAGTYDVSVGDYGGYYFNHWADGANTRDRSVAVTSSPITLTAVYSTVSSSSGGTGSVPSGTTPLGDGTGPSPTGPSSITVYAKRIPSSYWAPCFALTCSTGTGPGAAMYVALEDASGNVIASGFADENGYTFNGLNPSAQYYLGYPSDCDYCHNDPHNVVFSHWQDGSSIRPREVSAGQSLTAYYEYVPLT
jgi:hypothetical protein